jgi:hypothetical protein
VEDRVQQTRFLWGVALAWVPWIPTLIGLGYALRGIWNSHATGIAVVTSGIAEGFVLWGVVAMIIGQVTAIAFLVRGFSREHLLGSLLSAISICMSGLILARVSLSLVSGIPRAAVIRKPHRRHFGGGAIKPRPNMTNCTCPFYFLRLIYC